jgi:hypothetical protein
MNQFTEYIEMKFSKATEPKSSKQQEQLKVRLLAILNELEKQTHVSATYPPHVLPFANEMKQIREYIEVGEYGLAYESEVATLETHPFVLSGKVAVALLELALLFGFKTERKEDASFDRRGKQQ